MPIKYLMASKEFWLLNLSGWILYGLIYSAWLHGFGGVDAKFLCFLLICSLGSMTGLLVRIFYVRYGWSGSHPITLIPISCLIAIIFSLLITVINFSFVSENSLKTCFYFLSGSCSDIVEFASVSEYVMLVWVMTYFFVKHEREGLSFSAPRKRELVGAVVALLVVKEIGFFLEVIHANKNLQSDIFSLEYIFSNFIQVVSNIVFSLSIVLIRPRERLLGSRLMPLIPTVVILIFCASVLNVWVIDVFLRVFNLLTYQYLPEDGLIVTYLLFGSQSAGVSSNVFVGALEDVFRDNMVLALFILYCRYASYWQLDFKNIAPKFDAKKALQFWAYNLGGWFIAGVCVYISGLIGLEKVSNNLAIAFTVFFILIGLFMGVVLRSVIRHYRLVNSTLVVYAYKVAIIASILGLLQAFALWFCNYVYIYTALTGIELKSYEYYIRSGNYFYISIFVCGLCCFLWSLIYEISVSQREKLEFVLKQLQLEKNMKETQLNALAGKIDPHFIFNALNNIRSLINEDGEKARAAILVLSDILRSPISKNFQDKVTVLEEMTLVKNYIALSKIQLEHRLIYIENVEYDVQSVLIPSMMLQILVENAIKHGISQLPDGGTLTLTVEKAEKNLRATVINTGRLSMNVGTRGFGVGVKNIQERLQLLYGNDAIFSLQETQEEVVSQLILPLEYAL